MICDMSWNVYTASTYFYAISLFLQCACQLLSVIFEKNTVKLEHMSGATLLDDETLKLVAETARKVILQCRHQVLLYSVLFVLIFVIYSSLNKVCCWGSVAFAGPFLDCSQFSIFSYFYSLVERAERIARELDANSKRGTLQVMWWAQRKIEGLLCSSSPVPWASRSFRWLFFACVENLVYFKWGIFVFF